MFGPLASLSLEQLCARAEMRLRLVRRGVDPFAQEYDVACIHAEIERRRDQRVPIS